MPIYEYRRPDGTTFELQQSFSEDALKVDPDTGVPVERVLHAPAVHFKGKGFYNTDYGTRNRNRETAAAGDKSSSEKSDKSSSEKSDKTAEKSSETSSSEKSGSSASSSDSSSSSSSSSEGKTEKSSAKPKESKPVSTKS